MSKRIVLALGGNAISSGDHSGNIAEQFAQSRITAKHVADLICSGRQVLLTHGNGPQVGTELRRVELSRHEVYPLDLGLCVANTQATMGYMLCQCLENEMKQRGETIRTCTIITTVIVDPADEAFRRPTKPIGQVYDKKTIEERATTDAWNVVEIPGKGFRRVVPSPKPRAIDELPLIRKMFDEGTVLVACGGGGIPVVERPGWGYEGVEAVIDKDLTAALLAVGVEADTLAILTGVDKVCLNYGKPDEQPLDTLSVAEARRHHAAGQFPPGSMGPKIEACLNFVEKSPVPDAQAFITSVEGCEEAFAGKTGTRFTR